MEGSVALSEIVRNWAILGAAVAGVGIAIWRALAADRQSRAQAAQARTSDLQRVSELYSSALEGLGDDKLEVRLGAVLVLERLAADEPTMRQAAEVALQAFVRRCSQERPAPVEDVDFVEAWRIVSRALSGAEE